MTAALKQGDLFAATEAMREGIERADATVSADSTAEALVRRATMRLIVRIIAASEIRFTADNVGAILDGMGLDRKDQNLRKRIVSTIINRGKRLGYWRRVGYVPSFRRHCAPIAEWEFVPAPEDLLDTLKKVYAE